MTDRLTLRRIIPAGGTQDLIIAEPGGWVGHTIKLERHKEFHSVVETIFSEGKFIFVGDDHIDGPGGADFIRTTEQLDGVDAEIQFIAETAEDDVNFETYFIGQLQLEGLEELPDNEVEVPVIRDDFWSKFIRHYDTPVDLTKNEDIFGNAVNPAVPVNVTLTSQKVRQKYVGEYGEITDFIQYNLNTNKYGGIDFAKETLNEIDEKHNLPRLDNPSKPSPLYTVKYSGDYLIDFLISTSTAFILGAPIGSEIDVFIQVNNDTPIMATRTDFATTNSFEYTDTLSLEAGDNIRIYFWKDGSTVDPNWGVYGGSYLHITADTIYPETEVQGFFIHDLFAYVLVRIGLGDGSFYSDYLGNENTNARQYDEIGCASRFFVTKGLFIRGYTLSDNPDDPSQRYSLQEKGFQISCKDIWEGINPILCLGLGYETLEESPEQQVIRVEEREYFYDSTTTSLNFDEVYDISRSYDKDLIFKSVRTGYKRWESEKASGIDDPQTKHTRTIPFKHVGKELILESEFIAASLAWETTRRMSIEKSSDYKLDNNNFILAINIDDVTPEESPELYVPELNENFLSVTNLLHPETRYNLILTPLRNFLRNAKYILGCMQSYLTKSIEFGSGEGNYDMTSYYNCSTGEQCLGVICNYYISESDDIDLSVHAASIGYYHLPLEYPINLPMTWEEYKTLNQNRHISFGISKTDTGHTKFFIKECTFNKRDGQAELLGWPVTFFNVNADEGESGGQYDEDLQDLLDFADGLGYTLPSDEVIELLDDLITELKALGVWQDLDLLYIFSTDGDEDFATLNLINPATFKASRVNSPTWIPGTGFQGNGTNSYLNTGWAPNPDAVHFTQNDGGVFCYINSEQISGGNQFVFGVRGNVGGAFNGRTTLVPQNGSVHSFSVNSLGVNVGSSVTGTGFYHQRRVLSNDQRLFKNASQVGATNSNASTSLSTNELNILGSNEDGVTSEFSTHQIGIFGIGASFAGKEQELNDIFNTFTEAVALLPAGAFLREDDSGYIAREDDGLIIREN